ncbi:MAG: hypothetical protein F6K62_14105 [Sphaerospermopsis sp. SIO1G2]|nr:hypothetical protein [Sphaerospermopsis sp. SIO1G1]NET72016.1 hypothetical protein [Sphaerospermopsis sp. SIO1G2]
MKQNIESLKQDINAGIQQLKNGEYTEYDENNLSTLMTSIKAKGRKRLQRTISE